LPALFALGILGVWSSSSAAQYVGGVSAYGPGYYYATARVYHGQTYYYYFAPQSVTGPSYYVPARQYVAPPPTSQPVLVNPGVSSGWSYSAPGRSSRAAPSPSLGLEPESLPAQTAEEIAPATAAQWQAPPRRTPWWQRRMRWTRSSTNW
jgi:hypothetical protein